MRWLFVGAGNMASSLVGGLIARGAAQADIALIEPQTITRDASAQRFGVRAFASIGEANAWTDTSGTRHDKVTTGIVVAVKPDIVERVCVEIVAAGRAVDEPVLSVAAGVRMGAIDHWLGGGRAILRCIPNTPALLGLGATALVVNAACTRDVRAAGRAMLEAVGIVVDVTDETLIDSATALSGSGPAYVFRFIEHLIDGGVALGLERDAATALAIRTVEGAAAMAAQGTLPPATLRENVTSKGGTTAAALASFDHDGFGPMVLDAMTAARDRAVELGDASDPTVRART